MDDVKDTYWFCFQPVMIGLCVGRELVLTAVYPWIMSVMAMQTVPRVGMNKIAVRVKLIHVHSKFSTHF